MIQIPHMAFEETTSPDRQVSVEGLSLPVQKSFHNMLNNVSFFNRLKRKMDNLTDHQMSLMRAVLDGVVRFSASDVIEKYHLNSSANVRRVKDALRKKEILMFNEKDEPVIQDPLFEYWLSKYYFERQ